MEEWLDLYDFPDYEVSSEGRFRNIGTQRILRLSSNGQGVLKIVLSRNGVTYTRSAAKLVALTFHGEPPPGNVIKYNDDDPTNIRRDNLDWQPRWKAQKRAIQAKRTIPMRRGRILMESTGIIYDNSLECARQTDGIEEYIILCAQDPGNSRYNGSTYRWVE